MRVCLPEVLLFICFCIPSLEGNKAPNILFLLTDDQDVTAKSLDYMPFLNKLLRNEGMEFLNYFVPTGLCCPSRSTIIRGQYCHNTKIWDNGDLNNKTYLSGGITKFIAEGLYNSTIATLLQAAGYETVLIGKYLNGYETMYKHVPPGWTYWRGMTRLSYYGPVVSMDGKFEYHVPKTIYQTDYIRDWVLSYLTERRDEDKPFFMYIAPFAPHAPSIPAKRHENMFNNLKAPRYPSFNPSDDIQQQKPSWIKRLPLLTKSQIADIDNFYRNRLRALQAVDEMLAAIVETLDELDISKDTYIFYMGDNGQHLGDFRITPGKRQAYNTDVLVPFLVRGPGVKGGVKVTQAVMSVDLLPTWLDLANITNTVNPQQLDGRSIVSILNGKIDPSPKVNNFRSVALSEMYGGSSNMDTKVYGNMSGFWGNRFWNNTYQAIHVLNGSDWAEGANWLYAEWCTGEKEFYNSTSDFYHINNIINKTDRKLLSKLSLLVSKMGECIAEQCYNINYKEIAKEAARVGKNVGTNRLKCYNPPNIPGIKPNRRGWAYDIDVPEPFSNGFSFSDSDVVPKEQLQKWEEEYQLYFY